MLRFVALTVLTISMLSVGCCGPMGCGPGCNLPTCNDCDGLAVSQQNMPYGPLDGLRQLRRNITCGSGCGEVYVGEWISTPPDCADPCAGDQWVGGAGKCQPFCWAPGTLLGQFQGRLMGGRFCSGAESSQPCGCDECSNGGAYVQDTYVEEAHVPAAVGAGCGLTGCNGQGCSSGSCATGSCSSGTCSTGGCASGTCASAARPRMATSLPAMSARAMNARVNRIRR